MMEFWKLTEVTKLVEFLELWEFLELRELRKLFELREFFEVLGVAGVLKVGRVLGVVGVLRAEGVAESINSTQHKMEFKCSLIYFLACVCLGNCITLPPELQEYVDDLHKICVQKSGITEDGNIQYDFIIETAHPQIKDLLVAAINKCRVIDAGADLCEKASNFNLCMYGADPVQSFNIVNKRRALPQYYNNIICIFNQCSNSGAGGWTVCRELREIIDLSSPVRILFRSTLTYRERNRERSRKITVLDGGFATQLSCHVNDPIDGDVLWSSRFLETNPEAVVRAHLDFLRAGADVIITNTYQSDVDLFVKHLNVTKDEAYNLIKKAVELAQIAVQRYQEEFPDNCRPLIAGSVGPYGASLHDGSEYTGSYAKTTSAETMRKWHLPRIKALIEAGVDMLAIETIPCSLEAEMLQDGQSIAVGESFKQVARRCFELNPEQLVAVGINCCAPRLVESLITGINEPESGSTSGCEDQPRIPLIVYPNSGENYDVQVGWIKRDKCEPVENFVSKWLDLGVTWIGGCCRTYATDVAKIRNEVDSWCRKNSAEK
nr:unnamed protein product [Callosobruchus chinensis]